MCSPSTLLWFLGAFFLITITVGIAFSVMFWKWKKRLKEYYQRNFYAS